VRKQFVMAALGVLAIAACSRAVPDLAIVANATGSLGTTFDQRLLVALVDSESEAFLASPDLPVSVDLAGPDGEEITAPGSFLWTVPDARGLYLVNTPFPAAGQWYVTLSPEGMDATLATPFQVVDDPVVPEVGEAAPSTATRTSADHDLSEISSDTSPDPDFYSMSLDEAIASGRPTVVVFATPGLCTSRTCGPMLDQVKSAKAAHPNANYVHVEIYEDLTVADQSQLQVVDAVRAWGLPNEPWTFVVDEGGKVAARFEGAMGPEELEAALTEVGA
jgi:hypothetical protein